MNYSSALFVYILGNFILAESVNNSYNIFV